LDAPRYLRHRCYFGNHSKPTLPFGKSRSCLHWQLFVSGSLLVGGCNARMLWRCENHGLMRDHLREGVVSGVTATA
jgi:hypothetical protein